MESPRRNQVISDAKDRFTNPLSDDISIDELQNIFLMVHPSHNLSREHFSTTIQTLCDDDVCQRTDLERVLKELVRRMNLREILYWDFQLLDLNNNGRIGLDDAKYLFQQTHGSEYNIFWEAFVANRKVKDNKAVTFEEIETYLCTILVPGQN